jgi:hypothetical protein
MDLNTLLSRILAASLALATLPALSAVGAVLALFVYNVTHAIPDPIARGEDLGNGFATLLGLVIGFFISVPTSLLVYRFLSRKLLALKGPSKSG